MVDAIVVCRTYLWPDQSPDSILLILLHSTRAQSGLNLGSAPCPRQPLLHAAQCSADTYIQERLRGGGAGAAGLVNGWG